MKRRESDLRSGRAFLEKDDGAITALMVILFIGIVASTGIAVDLMRAETRRSDLQDAVDRGVLAAASLTQTLDAKAVVEDYVATRFSTDQNVSVAVDPDIAVNGRRVAASASYSLDTFFLRLVGMDTLTIGAPATAEERQKHVEISLALDISGSMAREDSSAPGETVYVERCSQSVRNRWGGYSTVYTTERYDSPQSYSYGDNCTQWTETATLKRLDVLKASASTFVENVLARDVENMVSISLIPYAGQVNPGQSIFEYYNSSRVHDYSTCIEFNDSDFDGVPLPATHSRAQVPHFQWFRYEADYGFDAQWGWCPTGDRTILPFSNDVDALKARIANFSGHDGTGTQNAMKWGMALLDPSSQGLVSYLNGRGEVPDHFASRPADFGTDNALKILVLMTDGNIRYQQRPKATSYDSSSEISYLASNNLSSDKATLSTSSAQTADEAKRVQQFLSLCEQAKAKGVIVFTIGFDVESDASVLNELRTCASSASHFYHVEGIQLDEAFGQIASSLQALKLVN